MKNILSVIITAFVFVLSSCNWDDFGDLNVNPNEATTPITSALLTNSMLSVGATINGTTGTLYAQHLANKQYTSGDNYQTISFSSDALYNGPLTDLQKIIDLNTNSPLLVVGDGFNDNQIAIAKIMMSYFYLHMTDRWGDLPYSEALKGTDGLLSPVFDTQEDIYDDVFQTLKDAVAMIDTRTPQQGVAAIKGDIMLNGNMALWIKFANTIRLNAALRLSEVDPTKAETEFVSAFNAGVIDSLDNTENISYKYLRTQQYENPFYNSFVTLGRADWTIPDPLMNMMQLDTYTSPHLASYADGHPYKSASGKLDVAIDPRLPIYANPIENTASTYIGMPYGLSEAAAGAIPAPQVSFMGNALRTQDAPANVFTSAQVAFILAEGALNGWIGAPADAKTYYELGIKASLNQYGVGAGYATYITNSEVAYDPTRALEQIITQKWIAIFPNGYEAWSEWRRTGFPVLAPGDNALTPNNQIPTRQGYGTAEANANKTNYDAALANQGFTNDDLTGKVWWDN